MKFTSILFTWLVFLLLGVATIVAVVTSYLPSNQSNYTTQIADDMVFTGLYAGVFIAVLGLSGLIGYGLRWLSVRRVTGRDYWPIARHAVLVAILATSLLALQGFRVLSWWDGILLVVALILVELSFRVKPAIGVS